MAYNLPVIFINLNYRKDRLDHIVSHLKHYEFKNLYRYNAHNVPKNGHLGCAKSHLGSIEYAQQNQWQQVLILEDDFQFTVDAAQVHIILQKIQDLKYKWQIILLTHCFGTESKTQFGFLNQIVGGRTSSGYLVHINYYPVLIKLFQSCIDNMTEKHTSIQGFEPMALDQQWCKLQEKDTWFVTNPKLGQQNQSLYSSIQSSTIYHT